MNPKKFVRVGCYVRVSTENQIENYSIEEQIQRLKAYCLAKDWLIHKIYTDGGYSGGNLQRPALNQMLQDIHSNKLDMVVVYKLDRLSRSQKDTLMLIEDEFLSNNVDFVSMSENFDTSTPFGRAMIGILSVFAQLEKDQITERFTMGRIGRSKAGYYHGGATAPTGYDYVDGKLVVNEYKSMQVKEVFKRFLTGHSINSIQKYMHSKYGNWNSHSLVINVLRNSVYIGKVKFKGKEYDGIHKPIISKDIFEQVQTLLISPDRESAKTTAQKTPFRANYLLSSIIYCNRCGARYSAVHGFYKCYSRSKTSRKFVIDPNCKNENWKINELDELVINQIRRLCYNKNNLDDMFNSSKATEEVNVDSIKNKINNIDGQINRMIDLYQVGTIPMEKISQRISLLQNEKDKLSEIIKNSSNDKQHAKEEFIKNLSRFKEVFEGDSLEEKRLFISTLVTKVLIDGHDVSIEWRI